jgi:hypothetical protein
MSAWPPISLRITRTTTVTVTTTGRSRAGIAMAARPFTAQVSATVFDRAPS